MNLFRGDQMLTSSTAFDVTKGEDAPEIGATGPVTGIAYKDCNWKIPYKVTFKLIYPVFEYDWIWVYSWF